MVSDYNPTHRFDVTTYTSTYSDGTISVDVAIYVSTYINIAVRVDVITTSVNIYISCGVDVTTITVDFDCNIAGERVILVRFVIGEGFFCIVLSVYDNLAVTAVD